MKLHKRYNYELPNQVFEPFIALKYIGLILWWSIVKKKPYYFRTVPTWFVRYLGTAVYRVDAIDKRKHLVNSFHVMYTSANTEWLLRKNKLIKLTNREF